jgi:hypothetical protein
VDKLIADVIRREVINTAAYARGQEKNYMERMHEQSKQVASRMVRD